MRPSRRPCICASLALLACSVLAPRTYAEALTITSAPPGATVEIDGVVVGTTPFVMKYPHGYFRKTTTIFEARLQHPISVRISKDGFTSQEMRITEGPFEWESLNGRNHGPYYLLKTSHVQASLQPLSAAFTGSVKTTVRGREVVFRPEIPIEQIVQDAMPAVVTLRNSTGLGSGFLITDTGVIATNRHVAAGEAAMTVGFTNGHELRGKVILIDPNLDLALVKIDGSGFPYLRLADPDQIRIGESVIAIGSPLGLEGTVTRGIISTIKRSLPDSRGSYLQTDAAINHGNSGGPLLDMHGDVVGINSARLETDGGDNAVNGIAFALSSEDILAALHKFYPARADSSQSVDADPFGHVTFTSEDSGSEIYIDGRFVGQTPATISLSAGTHHVEVKASGKQSWSRDLEVLKDSQLTLHPVLSPAP